MVATGPLSRRTPSSLESGCGQKNLEYGGFILESDEVSIAANRGARPTGGVAFAIDRDEDGLRCASGNCSSGGYAGIADEYLIAGGGRSDKIRRTGIEDHKTAIAANRMPPGVA
jgi:hypothetical protein